MDQGSAVNRHSMLDTKFPVHLPDFPELRLTKTEFDEYITSLWPTEIELPLHLKNSAAEGSKTDMPVEPTTSETSKFMDGLSKHTVPSLDQHDGKMLTENSDVAYSASGSALVDLFHELEDVVSGDRLAKLLENAWSADSEATLKIIWNARSIHLGKSSKNTFYRAVGWLAEHHPQTLLINLPWLVRPLIQKKVPKPESKDAIKDKQDAKPADAEMIDHNDAESDFEFIDEDLEGRPEAKKVKLDSSLELSEFDVKYGVAHGYWKDLLNILVLAANDQLKVNGDPRSVFNIPKPTAKPHKRDWTGGKKKVQTADRHERVVKMLRENTFYKALHLTVARLFADQLKVDCVRLESGKKSELKRITLAGKWAPSNKGMHDQHTCIVSSIAEILYPFDSVCPAADSAARSTYLKHARQAYQAKTLSGLRKALEVVERPITDNRFDQINYDRVPSLAMKQYTSLFAKKDFERFDSYLDKVAEGKSRISGATLLPSTLVADIRDNGFGGGQKKKPNAMVEQKLREIRMKSADGQWNALVQRIKDNGTLESSIAVCDVSGSMTRPRFPDGTCPMDSAIGLSLLLAEVTKAPFGGKFITFSADPRVMQAGGAGDKRSFDQKIKYIEGSDWGMNTDFVAVFERLILPMAIEHKLTQDDMVKQIFIFSDMQFDHASSNQGRWTTSYERIQKQYENAGYKMPKLIFWNLAGGRAGYDAYNSGNEVVPKPVTAAEENTALVSGYSQGQLKMFLDNGQFEDPEDEEVIEEKEEGDDVLVKKTVKKAKQDPLATVMKAISHDAYRMLRVVD